MSTGKLPEWLPPGWTVEVRPTKRGGHRRYYTSPISGQSFCSKGEVLQHLNIEKGIGQSSKQASPFGDHEQHLVAKVEDSPKWLPSGWILEIKTHMKGLREGKNYKCYFDPSTGSRFYSKREVFRFLEKRKRCSSSSNHKKNPSSAHNVLSQFQYTPDGLPHGWIKEIRFRKATSGKSGVRKDPYYTDPVNGYVFRSLRDVFRYIETGVVSKHAVRTGSKRQISEVSSLEMESPASISAKKLKSEEGEIRRSLFSGQTPDSNGEKMMDTDQSPEKQETAALVHLSSQFEQAKIEAKKRGNKVLKLATKKLPESVNKSVVHVKKEREKIAESEPGTSESMEKKPSEPLNQIPLDLSDGKQVDLVVKKSPQLSEREQQEQASKTPVGNTPELESEKHPELESGRHPIPEVKLFEPESDKLLMQEDKLLEPENKLFPLEGQQSQSACERSDKKGKKCETRTTQTQKASILPRRASKRLAGVEPDRVIDLEISDRPRRIEPMPSSKLKDTLVEESISCNQHGEEPMIDLEPLEDPEGTLGEQVTSGEEAGDWKPTDEWPDSPLTLPFGDSWPDPCIEFAFKTLTGDIPVLDDSLQIEEYFQQQLGTLQISSPNGLASLPSDIPASQLDPPFQMMQPEEFCLEPPSQMEQPEECCPEPPSQMEQPEKFFPEPPSQMLMKQPEKCFPEPPSQMKQPEKCYPSTGEERQPYFLENGVLSNGKVKKEPRRSTRLKNLGA